MKIICLLSCKKKIFDINADNFFGGIRFFLTFIMYNYRLQKQDLSK